MKSLVLLVSLLLSSAIFANGYLDGDWEMTNRICSDGSIPNDRLSTEGGFVLVNINAEYLLADITIGSYRYLESSIISYVDNTISTTHPDGYVSISSFSIITRDFFQVISSGFQQGGSCAPTERLYMDFRRVQ